MALRPPSSLATSGTRSRRRRSWRAAGLTVAVTAALSLTPLSATATGPVVFDGSPGVSHPAPATLGGYAMTAYPVDGSPTAGGTAVTELLAPGGDHLGMSSAAKHYRGEELNGGWGGTTGVDVYVTDSGPLTMTLPARVDAFSFYAITDHCGTFEVTATTDDGTTSGPQPVTAGCADGNNHPRYFGFYTTDGSAIETITLSANSPAFGLIVGEMAQHQAAPKPVKHVRSLTLGFAHKKVNGATQLALSGDVSVAGDAPTECIDNRQVIIKTYKSSISKWVKNGVTNTDSVGHFTYTKSDRARAYRARVPGETITTDGVTSRCAATRIEQTHTH